MIPPSSPREKQCPPSFLTEPLLHRDIFLGSHPPLALFSAFHPKVVLLVPPEPCPPLFASVFFFFFFFFFLEPSALSSPLLSSRGHSLALELLVRFPVDFPSLEQPRTWFPASSRPFSFPFMTSATFSFFPSLSSSGPRLVDFGFFNGAPPSPAFRFPRAEETCGPWGPPQKPDLPFASPFRRSPFFFATVLSRCAFSSMTLGS